MRIFVRQLVVSLFRLMPAVGLFFFLSVGSAQSECPAFELGRDSTLKEKLLAWTSTFNVHSDGEYKGEISRRMISLTPEFFLKDSQRSMVARARQKIFSWGVTIEVFDCNDYKIGTIKENVLKSFFDFYSVYSILDGDENIVAISEKTEFFETRVRLYSEDNRYIMAELHRPWFTGMTDRWDISLFDSELVDPRVLVMIGAYKSYADEIRRANEFSDTDWSDLEE